MGEKFNPYIDWLGIPENQLPPTYYRLLGVETFETNTTAISNAADRVMLFIRTFQMGQHSDDSQRLLNEIAAARVCLLNPQKKAEYDDSLRGKNVDASPSWRRTPPPPASAVTPAHVMEVPVTPVLFTPTIVTPVPVPAPKTPEVVPLPPPAVPVPPPAEEPAFRGFADGAKKPAKASPQRQKQMNRPRYEWWFAAAVVLLIVYGISRTPRNPGTENVMTRRPVSVADKMKKPEVVQKAADSMSDHFVGRSESASSNASKMERLAEEKRTAARMEAEKRWQTAEGAAEEEEWQAKMNEIERRQEAEAKAEANRLAAVKAASSLNTVVQDGQKAGDRMELTVGGVKYAFRWCPAGTFMMGSPVGELGRYSYETQHQVTLTKGFWILETPVTQEMWEKVTGKNPSKWKGNRLPVEDVSWIHCQDYIKMLNTLGVVRVGYKFSLPTEAQWEYACRAGTTTAFNNGKNLTSNNGACPNMNEVGWDRLNSGSKTQEVGLKKANGWGLYDMHGNVWEWCLDWRGDYSSSSVTDPTGPKTGTLRVLRGGSWYWNAKRSRSADRGNKEPTNCYSDDGLRLVLVHE